MSFSDSNGIWTYTEDIRSGVFGGDEVGGNYTFNDIVHFNEDLIYKSTLIEDLFLNRSGDSMTGELDMQNNNITNIGVIRAQRMVLTSLSEPSIVGDLYADNYYTKGAGTSYFLNPAGTSNLNALEVQKLTVNKGALTSYPSSWGDGIHTWDVYAEGSIATGRNGNKVAGFNHLGDSWFPWPNDNDDVATKQYVDNRVSTINSCKVCIACSDDGTWNGMVVCDGPNNNGWHSSGNDFCADGGRIALKFVCGTDSYSNTWPNSPP